MFSHPIFDDSCEGSDSGNRDLSESFYKTLFKRLCESFDYSTQALFSECIFGIAPSPAGENTLFIVAPSQEVLEKLIARSDRLQNEVNRRLPGIKQTAICVQPPDADRDRLRSSLPPQFPPQFMLGKIFRHSAEDESVN
ncbi:MULTISPECIES: hypothetical protein [Planktothricoides]|uniref:Uncharacterized protein n=2 Tax=Planktothricoides raciborskii TaxID=132608 RepID=A0AAU8JHN1_9CYAN|nr:MULTISPECIES: hypothetical protein [Planktothricoides]KOR35237.1 hypothetical protein AM228_19600 [Planktothricoides sp. SR001]MBD2544789.1 hypothetical protein [Planktothricoides raciborskii FACHB-1370]MBD2582804.1 hypothetical protein [Planktothricoides raciborskii FACHB-1261]